MRWFGVECINRRWNFGNGIKNQNIQNFMQIQFLAWNFYWSGMDFYDVRALVLICMSCIQIWKIWNQCPIVLHFRPSGPSENGGWRDFKSNWLIGMEFCEFRQKHKIWNFTKIQDSRNSWVLSGAFPCHLKRFLQLHVFSFFLLLEFWLGRGRRRGFLV